MKHVAIFVPQFPVLTETFVATEIDALINAGHQVSVITFNHRSVFTKHPYPGYELRRYKCAASINGLLKTTVSNLREGWKVASSQTAISNLSLLYSHHR